MQVVSNFEGRSYQSRFDELAAAGVDVHGEATLVLSLRPSSALDAGCGTGRVAIELARHGVVTLGVDRDESMIAEARRLAPELEWMRSDLATLRLARQFDVVVLAGNVPLFCEPSYRDALVRSCASHVNETGRLLAGFQLDRGYELREYDDSCTTAGFVLVDRWSTWDQMPFLAGGTYAVSVHARAGA